MLKKTTNSLEEWMTNKPMVKRRTSLIHALGTESGQRKIIAVQAKSVVLLKIRKSTTNGLEEWMTNKPMVNRRTELIHRLCNESRQRMIIVLQSISDAVVNYS